MRTKIILAILGTVLMGLLVIFFIKINTFNQNSDDLKKESVSIDEVATVPQDNEFKKTLTHDVSSDALAARENTIPTSSQKKDPSLGAVTIKIPLQIKQVPTKTYIAGAEIRKNCKNSEHLFKALPNLNIDPMNGYSKIVEESCLEEDYRHEIYVWYENLDKQIIAISISQITEDKSSFSDVLSLRSKFMSLSTYNSTHPDSSLKLYPSLTKIFDNSLIFVKIPFGTSEEQISFGGTHKDKYVIRISMADPKIGKDEFSKFIDNYTNKFNLSNLQ